MRDTIEDFRKWCRARCPGDKGCLARKLHDKGVYVMPGLQGHINFGALRQRYGHRKEFEEKVAGSQ